MRMGKAKIQYHPAFASGIELLMWDYQASLVIETEHELSRKPLKMDLLIVKKKEDVDIENEIGYIFRGHNIIEYKSPADELSIDQYSKVMAYAFLYKALGKTVNEVPVEEITVSIFRHSFPRKLFKSLQDSGCSVEKASDGVYYVKGPLAPFPTQTIVMKDLPPEKYTVLRILAPGADPEDIRRFVLQSSGSQESGYRRNVDAVYQVSVSANREVYENLRKEDQAVCDALRDLMKEDFLRVENEGLAKGIAGAVEIMREDGKDDRAIVERLMSKYDLTQEEAEKYVLVTV